MRGEDGRGKEREEDLVNYSSVYQLHRQGDGRTLAGSASERGGENENESMVSRVK